MERPLKSFVKVPRKNTVLIFKVERCEGRLIWVHYQEPLEPELLGSLPQMECSIRKVYSNSGSRLVADFNYDAYKEAVENLSANADLCEN